MQLSKDQVNIILKNAPYGSDKKKILDNLILSGHDLEGVDSVTIRQSLQPKPAEQTFGQELKKSLDTRVERTSEILNRPDTNIVEKGVQLFGQGAGLGADVIEKTVEQVPGVKQVITGMGKGIQWLSQTEPIKALGEKIGEQKAVQEAVTLYDTDENFRDSVDAVANIVRLGGDVTMAQQATNFTKNVTNKLIDKTKSIIPGNATPSGVGSTPIEPIIDINKVKSAVTPKSPEIMNRVARLKPTDATKFKNMTGKTQGEYLTETGNFGAPDKIIQNEASKFTQTLASKEAELAKLPGIYKHNSITEASKELVKKARAESSGGVKAPYLDEALKLQAKAQVDGLTHAEINILKKLFEKNVKLGYNKLTADSSIIKKATNIDSALRAFQDETAKSVGFKNLPELNKQIQTSKFLIDKLGDEVVGKNGLNNVGLTDWIVLSGGDPTSVGAFLTKRFFSSKNVQAKVAEMLNKGEIKNTPTPNVKLTPEGIERQVSPKGLKQLKAPQEGAPQFQINTSINQPSRKAIEQGTEIVARNSSTQIPQPQSKKVKLTYTKTVPSNTTKVKSSGVDKSLEPKIENYKQTGQVPAKKITFGNITYTGKTESEIANEIINNSENIRKVSVETPEILASEKWAYRILKKNPKSFANGKYFVAKDDIPF